MGCEIGQWREWDHDRSLDWHLLEHPLHAGLKAWVRDVNRLYRACRALHERDCTPGGFEWIDCGDREGSVFSFLRRGLAADDFVLVVCNFTPVVRSGYRVGVPSGGFWWELLNSDAREYGGSGVGNLGGREASDTPCHGRPFSLELTLPPLTMLVLKPHSPTAETEA
jgi:1,4-alpha-glucan branching enzyme